MKVHGRRAVMFVKEFKLSGDMSRMSITVTPDTAEVTAFEDQSKEFIEGQFSWAVGMEGYWDPAINREDEQFAEMVGFGTQVIGIYPGGTAPSITGYEGKGILTNYSPEATMGGAVVFSADAQGSDDMMRTTILDSGHKVANGTSTPYNIGTAGMVRGIIGVFRALGTAITSGHGTLTASIWASATEGGTYGQIIGFTQITTPGGTFTPTVEYKTTATAQVGPWFEAVRAMTAGDDIEISVSCGTEE
ncbi:hypothetical protein LCGC14_2801490 [marine sediment metagenome]|uniref:Uncharacterized protein n=1 Tax=marine sediment metagenome TaxID=412755 RepID=A0A0F9AW01_9ZZZZ